MAWNVLAYHTIQIHTKRYMRMTTLLNNEFILQYKYILNQLINLKMYINHSNKINLVQYAYATKYLIIFNNI